MENPVDVMLTAFPKLVTTIVQVKDAESRRSDITKILCELLRRHETEDAALLVHKAVNLYEELNTLIAIESKEITPDEHRIFKEGMRYAAAFVKGHWNSITHVTNQREQALRSASAVEHTANTLTLETYESLKESNFKF